MQGPPGAQGTGVSLRVRWQRLDRPGHDACTLSETPDGHRIEGIAATDDTTLRYTVETGPGWVTRTATVDGTASGGDVSLRVTREETGRWIVGGTTRAEFDGLTDIDLGFTPATNTLALRRLGLPVGVPVETTAVWLDETDWTFRPLRQVYTRIDARRFTYASPDHGYEATLQADPDGLVVGYPDLWRRA
ncbi:hypothetical protein HKCCE2091_11465 [Rhodobacterales bacterium HKCCE2091]|nr:hypothetical protein [Rhodobacterales bacterium HKCCE2091]